MQEEMLCNREWLYARQIKFLIAAHLDLFRAGFEYEDREFGSDPDELETFQQVLVVSKVPDGLERDELFIEVVCGDPNDPFELIYLSYMRDAKNFGQHQLIIVRQIDADHYTLPDIHFYLTEALGNVMDGNVPPRDPVVREGEEGIQLLVPSPVAVLDTRPHLSLVKK